MKELGLDSKDLSSHPVSAMIFPEPLYRQLAGERDRDSEAFVYGDRHMLFYQPLQANPWPIETSVHECTHVLLNYLAKKRDPKIFAPIPLEILEGAPTVIGLHAAKDQGETGLLEYLRENVVRSQVNDADAAYVIGNVLFMEFLRLNYQPDGVQAIARLFEKLGSKESLPNAFLAEFGIDINHSFAAFRQYLKDTQGSPQARIHKTLFDSD